jgi:Mrp family chromosome partitioning ATPase
MSAPHESLGIGVRSLLRGPASAEVSSEAIFDRVRRAVAAVLRGMLGIVIPGTPPLAAAPPAAAPLAAAPLAAMPAVAGARTAPRETSAAIIRHLSNDSPGPADIQLVQRVFLRPGTESPRSVLFTGVGHDNGCASICMRAGKTLANLHAGSVCVVDANVRSTQLHRHLAAGGSGAPGTTAVQAASALRLAQRLSPENLWLLSSDTSPSTPDLLLTRDGVRPQAPALGGEFDRVLIAAPPINQSPESLALSQRVDGVVLVLQANATRREMVRSVKDLLDALNVRLFGVVLNDRTFPIPESLYRIL